METTDLAEYGKLLVKQELLKRGIHTVDMPHSFNFDLYTDTHTRVDIKTARKSTSKVIKQEKYVYEESFWTFNNKTPTECEYIALVCFDEEAKVERYYILPKAEATTKLITIHESKTNRASRSKFAPFKNNWEQLKQ